MIKPQCLAACNAKVMNAIFMISAFYLTVFCEKTRLSFHMALYRVIRKIGLQFASTAACKTAATTPGL